MLGQPLKYSEYVVGKKSVHITVRSIAHWIVFYYTRANIRLIVYLFTFFVSDVSCYSLQLSFALRSIVLLRIGYVDI